MGGGGGLFGGVSNVLFGSPQQAAVPDYTGAAQQTAQYGTGRNVPLDLAKSSYEQIQQNIPKLQQLYGNRLLIINNEGAVDLSLEQSIVSKFLNSPPSSPAAVQWIKSHGQAQGQQLDNRLAQQQRQAASAQRAPAYTQGK